MRQISHLRMCPEELGEYYLYQVRQIQICPNDSSGYCTIYNYCHLQQALNLPHLDQSHLVNPVCKIRMQLCTLYKYTM